MNPQADNTADPLKQRLSQTPPTPRSGPLHVPERRAENIQDIDDSAFRIDDDTPARPAPQPPLQAAPQPVTLPVQPQPKIDTPPPTPPIPQPQPAPAPPQPPVTPPAAPVAPVTPPAPQPPVVPTPTPPPQSPPTAAPVAPAPQPSLSQLPPIPVTPVETAPPPQPPPAPTPPTQPTQPPVTPPAASYQPTTQHIARDLIERIDETPQQNSKDIEALIEHNHNLHRLKSFASFLVFCAGVVIAAFLINQFVFQSYYVDGTSMTPTLQNDDRLIIDKVEHTVANAQGKSYIPKRGQVVVLDSSIVGFNGRDEQLIKRVIGLPGDTISIHDGTVTIKNKQNPQGFDPAQQLGLQLAPTYVESPQEWTIEANQVFVMGDNRGENGSYDSRAFGPVEANKIVGRLWARILPFNKAQVF